jgi:hypothetical protein
MKMEGTPSTRQTRRILMSEVPSPETETEVPGGGDGGDDEGSSEPAPEGGEQA